MCVLNPVPFHSNEPITAYKVMYSMNHPTHLAVFQSYNAGNSYELGKQYRAEKAEKHNCVETCSAYSEGFHAYEKLSHAIREKTRCQARCERRLFVIEVELSELTFKGHQTNYDDRTYEDDPEMPTFVANKCKFVKIVR